MTYPQIDPVIVHLGPLQLRWYGLMYVIGFIVAYFVTVHICRRRGHPMTRTDVEDFVTYCILGLVLGARIGYCLIYNPVYYLTNPLKFLAVWEGGMSFHGGLIGLVLTGILFARARGKPFLLLADLGGLAATPGLFFGRIGNFINAELFGRVTDVPWGMVFPGGGPLPRHPSQLYEAFSEGLLLFVILYVLSRKVNTRGVVFGVFLAGYGLLRFIMEFFREPDPQIGFVFLSLTMGQTLCLIMVAAGLGLIGWRLKSRRD
ncbi:MAG TPA: prolipoprotein diacylglyceryl transferase [Deltaproteobacteria bacterium]|jgi:phosphatidylglycerol:prolipoprotein diacylglycerol transferase|nr:prolipoprotein diacylglyceryl transferase [Deltaproteobacteria bacterium]OQC29236.1 MAG: Prolipoprotein diacylglyceryl transferase [Deltaproteobacteria bacterium ADurb.Bin072]NMD39964.1 prolipoprotein diacylglyceryl transferase [Deltaproteobacteria bacterium]HNQ86134.1 prolipoprotein diacylglyceryl transferase [Deltaproteobacteria bacterium]HNS90548.1 prolipoprotein diacylglyceryl transferase [Deltaproteobacteria bacterium]